MLLTRQARYWIVIGTLLLGFCGASASMLVELRRDSWTMANTGARNLLTLLSQDIEGNIRSYDRILTRVVSKLEEPGFSDLDPQLQQLFLFEGNLIEPYFTSLLVLDKAGTVIRDAGSVPARADNFADRSYFQAHATGEAKGLFISPPFHRRLAGKDPVVGLSRRINASDGTFAGVVVGTLRLAYFQELFARAELKRHDAINLFSQAGILLMRSPYTEDQIGRDLSSTDNVRRFQAAEAGVFTGVATFDGIKRVYNFQHVGDLPLILNVALSTDEIFAGWRDQAYRLGGILVFLCVLTGVFGFLVRREFLRRALAEARTRESEAQYRLLADNATDVILRLDRDLTRRYVSPAVVNLLGFEPAELLGKSTREVIHPDDLPLVDGIVGEACSSKRLAEAVYRVKHKSGRYVWVEGRYSFVAEDEGFIVVLRDISGRKSAELKLAAAHDELAMKANTDGLTGLANRRRFDEVLQAEYEKAAENKGTISLLLFDVDRFKLFNDSYGHQAGDECLSRVAKAIAACTRPSDLCARYGGEEIAVLLPGSDEKAAIRVGERIRAAVEALDIPHRENHSAGQRVTISGGSATQQPQSSDDDPATLIAQADKLLYEAKRTGRNRVLSPSSVPSEPQAPSLDHEQRRAHATGSFLEAAREKGRTSLDLIARSAADLLHAPIGFISLVGTEELTLVGRHGLVHESVPRDIAFCAHTITGTEPMIVHDTLKDARFKHSPLTKGEDGLRFYAGAPLIDPSTGEMVGAVCVCDVQPRKAVTVADREILKDLSKLVINELR